MLPQYFMFPETYGRTLEELAFLFEDRALAEEATSQVEKQMEWSEQQRWSRVDERMSWDMDVIVPSRIDDRKSADNRRSSVGARSPAVGVREVEHGGNRQAIRGERGGWWDQ